MTQKKHVSHISNLEKKNLPEGHYEKVTKDV